MQRALDIATSITASSLRRWKGLSASSKSIQPTQLLVLYDFEASPECRLVREALTDLDLDAKILPCPINGTRYRAELIQKSGTDQLPYLVDPNTETAITGATEIIEYLNTHYGNNQRVTDGLDQSIGLVSSKLASLARGQRGRYVRASRPANKLLELYSFESSPYSRLVRERLSELELAYILRNMGKATIKQLGPPLLRELLFAGEPIKGRNRKRLFAATGRMQVPYLIDPNTNKALFESKDILSYLNTNYAV